MQKPSKQGHADSYVKLLWCCQLQGAKKPSELPKAWILKGFEFFCYRGILWFRSSRVCKIKIKKREKILLCKYWSWDYYFLRWIQINVWIWGSMKTSFINRRVRNSNTMAFDPVKKGNIAQERDHLMFEPSDLPGKAL